MPRVRGPWRAVAGFVALLVVLFGIGTSYVNVSATTTSTSPPSTTTTQPLEARQVGWTAVSASRRGVMVDYRVIPVGGASFTVVRLRARTTLLRWHVGGSDPNRWALAPTDAGPRIDWKNEGPAGVVAVFNGAFKQAAGAGGAVVDGVVLEPLIHGSMTLALDRFGHWEMGAWGARNFPTPGFQVISYRQNLQPLVLNGALTPGASGDWHIWGSPLNNNPLTARTGVGVDAQGNLVYVATMHPVLPVTLARALVGAGARIAMELDINPFWPIVGAALRPLHGPGPFPVQIPFSMHDPTIFTGGWSRDFFVALAQPATWSCAWQSPGVKAQRSVAQPQPLSLVGAGCTTTTPPPTTSTTSTVPTSTTSTSSTTAP